jgi:RNA-directed DNA polymerase
MRRVAACSRTGKDVNDMGKGRWQPGAANRNQAGPQGQRLEPGNEHGLSEPCAVKSRMHGSSGGKAPQGAYLSQFLCADKKTLEASRERAVQWLKTMGLEMKPSKTRITHTLEQVDGNTGFDFLGFHVRQYKKGKDHSAKGPRGDPLGFKTLIKPCPEAVKAHTKKLKAIIRNGRGQPQEALIRDLNPRTRGWSRYYRTVISAKCFAKVDWDMGAMLWRWAKWENSKKGSEWRKTRYWQRVNSQDEFRTEEARLYSHSWTKIQRHKKVAGTASPFNGNLVYWAERLYKGPLTSTRLGKVLRQQKGLCGAPRKRPIGFRRQGRGG